MIGSNNPGMISPNDRLFYDSVVDNQYPVFRLLKAELGINERESNRQSRTIKTSLPSLKASYSLKHFKTSNVEEKSRIMKRTAIQEFIAAKREIIIHKVRMMEKRTIIKEMHDNAEYKENFLKKKVQEFNDDVGHLKQNFDQLKQQLEQLMEEVGILADIRDEKDRIWHETRNQVIDKENDIRKIDRRTRQHKHYQDFIRSMFEQFNQSFDEKYFMKHSKIDTYQRRKSMMTSVKNQDSGRRMLKGPDAEEKGFFITATARSHKRMMHQSAAQVEIRDEFMRLMTALEKQQYQMMDELQNEEANITEIDVEVSR